MNLGQLVTVPREGESFRGPRAKPDYRIDPDTGCWVWLKGTNKGYPHGFPKPHRAYYELATGTTLTPDIDVHHACHNKACVNPDHLEAVPHGKHLATHKRALGFDLTEADARAIRASTLTMPEIAEQYGITHSAVFDIRRGKSYKSAGGLGRPEVYCGWCGERITSGYRQKRYCTSDHRRKANSRRSRHGRPDRLPAGGPALSSKEGSVGLFPCEPCREFQAVLHKTSQQEAPRCPDCDESLVWDGVQFWICWQCVDGYDYWPPPKEDTP